MLGEHRGGKGEPFPSPGSRKNPLYLMIPGGAFLFQEAKPRGGQEQQEPTHCLRWGPEPTLSMMFSASAWQNPCQPYDKESGFAQNLQKASEISPGSLKNRFPVVPRTHSTTPGETARPVCAPSGYGPRPGLERAGRAAAHSQTGAT